VTVEALTQEEVEREQRMQEYHDEQWITAADLPQPITRDQSDQLALAQLIEEYIRGQRAEHRLYPEHWSLNLARHLHSAVRS
jgi:hypothetical protein